jgi:hypothetical protein
MANIKSILKERREYDKELITSGDSKSKREALGMISVIRFIEHALNYNDSETWHTPNPTRILSSENTCVIDGYLYVKITDVKTMN